MSDERPRIDLNRPGTLIVTSMGTGIGGTPNGRPVALGQPVVVFLFAKGYVGQTEQQATVQLVLRGVDASAVVTELTELLERNRLHITDHRCLSTCYVAPGVLKRCDRPLGHLVKPEVGHWHEWVEATRSDGHSTVARWKAADAQQPDETLECQRRNDL